MFHKFYSIGIHKLQAR